MKEYSDLLEVLQLLKEKQALFLWSLSLQCSQTCEGMERERKESRAVTQQGRIRIFQPRER